MLAGALAQFQGDRFLPPLSINIDVVGIQARRRQGTVPTAKEARLQRRERRLPQLIAALADGRPMQVVSLALRFFNQRNDDGLGPARPAGDAGVIDPRLLHRRLIGVEVIRTRRQERLVFSRHRVVRKVGPLLVQFFQRFEYFRIVPSHNALRPTRPVNSHETGMRKEYRAGMKLRMALNQPPDRTWGGYAPFSGRGIGGRWG